MDSSELEPGEWHLVDDDAGWTLRVRPVVAWTAFFPRSRRQWINVVIAGLFSLWILGILLPRPITPRSSLLGAVLLVWVAIAVAIWWRWAPPPIVAEHRRANAEQRVEVHGPRFDLAEGSFEVGRLNTLRLSSDGALPGRARLVFDGESVVAQALVGWPGLPEADASAARDAVLAKIAGPEQ